MPQVPFWAQEYTRPLLPSTLSLLYLCSTYCVPLLAAYIILNPYKNPRRELLLFLYVLLQKSIKQITFFLLKLYVTN